MTNSNDPVTPHLTYNKESGNANGFLEGLTKREHFAAMAMSSGKNAEDSLKEADKLIKLLNNES